MRVNNVIWNKLRGWGTASIFVFGPVFGAIIQGQSPTAATQDEVNRRVHQIVENNLQAGVVTTSNGVRATPMRADLSVGDMKEIRQFGGRAVAPLGEYLHSDDYRAQRLVVNVLGAIGGTRVVEPLSYAVEHSASAIVRYVAVANLGQQPWNAIAAVIKRVAVTDSDPAVRKKAGEVIAKQQPSTKK